jgi:hypothetical protein
MMVLYTGASVVAVGLQLRLPIALTSHDIPGFDPYNLFYVNQNIMLTN